MNTRIYKMNRLKRVLKVALMILPFIKSEWCLAQSLAMSADNNPGGLIMEMPIQLYDAKEESFYLNDDWTVGELVLLNNVTIPALPMKFNVKNKFLAIKHQDEVRICTFNKLVSFEWKSMEDSKHKKLINSLYYDAFADNNPKDILEIINAGDSTTLFKQYVIEIKSPTYVEEFDLGNRKPKVLIKKKYYLYRRGVFAELFSSLKKNKATFTAHYEAMEQYVKKHKLKLRNEEDLTDLVRYYESLL